MDDKKTTRQTRRLLTTKQAAAYCGLSPRTLERYRVTGEGPRFIKLGRRVLYDPDELDRWIRSGMRRSTSDPGPKDPEDSEDPEDD